MTIKLRNRLNKFLFLISLIGFALNVTIFAYCVMNYSVFDIKSLPNYISIFFLGFYVCLTSFIISEAFEKTQNTELIFFCCYLLACLAETSRIYVPLLNLRDTSSVLLIVLGNFSAFSRILVPLSFLFSVIMSGAEERQNIERNMALILVGSIFFALLVPLNTNVIEPTFRVHIGFNKIVVVIEILTDVFTVITLLLMNYKNGTKQWIVLGLVLVMAGYVLTVNGIDYVRMPLGIICLSAGTAIYLKSLHNIHMYD